MPNAVFLLLGRSIHSRGTNYSHMMSSLLSAVKSFLSAVKYPAVNSIDQYDHSTIVAVTQIYNEILKREPDISGLLNYCHSIERRKHTLQKIRKIFSNSDEYYRKKVRQIYQEKLNYLPDPVELHRIIQRLRTGKHSLSDLNETINNSIERAGSRKLTERLETIYFNHFNTPIPSCLYPYLTGLFDSCDEKTHLFIQRIHSARVEARRRLSPMFLTLYDREPRDMEVDKYIFFPHNDAALFELLAWKTEASVVIVNRLRKLAGSSSDQSVFSKRLVHVLTHPLSIGGVERLMSYWDKNPRPDIEYFFVYKQSPFQVDTFQFSRLNTLGYTTNLNLNAILRELDPSWIVDHTTLFHPETYQIIYRGFESRVTFFVHSCEIFDKSPIEYESKYSIKIDRLISNYRPSQYTDEWLNRKFLSISLSIEAERFSFQKRTYKFPLKVGIVGRLAKDKIPLSFVKALSEFRDQDFEFHIIGDGGEYKSRVLFELRNHPNVIYDGSVSPMEISSNYSGIDIFLCPSPIESGGFAMLEAMSTGIPVVARNTGPILKNVGDGGLVDGQDDQSLFRSLTKLKNLEYLEKLSKLAHKKVLLTNTNVQGQFDVYHQFLANETPCLDDT